MSEQPSIERATAADASAIRSMVNDAYGKYVERMGQMPAPMTEDYDHLVASEDVYVLRAGNEVVGAVVLYKDDQSLKIDNLVVSPAAQGRGYGRVLMKHAETLAKTQGLFSLTLFTNVKMHENIAMYTKMGFRETGRRNEDGFDRVFFQKDLT